MSETYVAFILSVPDSPDFREPDEDDYALDACNVACKQLSDFLSQNGHTEIWNCDEDWGVYLQSSHGSEKFQFPIGFFGFADNGDYKIIIQYYFKFPFLKSLFTKDQKLPINHQLHSVIQSFCNTYPNSEILTETKFQNVY